MPSPSSSSSVSSSLTSLPKGFASRYAFVDESSAPPTQPRRTVLAPTSRRPPLEFPSQYERRSRRTTSASHKFGPSPCSFRTVSSAEPRLASSLSSNTTPSASAAQPTRKKTRRTYDDPSPALTSYPSSSFPPVTDHLTSSDPSRRLDLLVCGLNPGLRSSQSGTHFAHPSNHFYKTLFISGLTPIRVAPEDCAKLVDQDRPLLSIGLTNICHRPTAEGGELGRRDYQNGTPVLARKICSVARPRVVVFTGKGIGVEWERCCREAGALSIKRKRAAIKAEVNEEVDGQSTARDAGEWTELPFPATVPWAPEEALGLGLMPLVIRNQIPAIRETSQMKKDTEEGEASAPLSATVRHDEFTFCFLTTSPSGRVTTMGIEGKSNWMRKCKECVDFLVVRAEPQGHGQVKAEEEPAEQVAMVRRRFEVINCERFLEGRSA